MLKDFEYFLFYRDKDTGNNYISPLQDISISTFVTPFSCRLSADDYFVNPINPKRRIIIEATAVEFKLLDKLKQEYNISEDDIEAILESIQ